MMVRPAQFRINTLHRDLLSAVEVKCRKYSLIKDYLHISHATYISDRNQPYDDLFTRILRGEEDQRAHIQPHWIHLCLVIVFSVLTEMCLWVLGNQQFGSCKSQV